MEANKNNINDIIDIIYLTPENAKFILSENKFLQLKATVKNPERQQLDKDGKENADKDKIEEFFFERVFLHRAFPFANPFEFISVSGNFPKTEEQIQKEKEEAEKKKAEEKAKNPVPSAEDNSPALSSESAPKENTTSFGDLKEIGIITNINIFNKIQQKYINDELNRKYFIPIIETINSVKEKYGFSYWDVKTNIGKIKFTVHDAFRNILKITEDRIMVTDVNGNRYEIVSLSGIDKQSFRKIELFL